MVEVRKSETGVRSDICQSDETSVTVHGYDLADELIGKIDLGSFAFLLFRGRLPNDAESALMNAAFVSLAEHGLTPNVLATRLTYLGAPESLQSAVAAGILGLGSRFVGTTEQGAQMIQRGTTSLLDVSADPPGEVIQAKAAEIVDEFFNRNEVVPGVGHRLHRPTDPRAEALLNLVEDQGFPTLPQQLMRNIAEEASRRSGRVLPVNVTGAIGVIATVLGLDWEITRGISVVARAIGLVGHLTEEIRQPMAKVIWRTIDEANN